MVSDLSEHAYRSVFVKKYLHTEGFINVIDFSVESYRPAGIACTTIREEEKGGIELF